MALTTLPHDVHFIIFRELALHARKLSDLTAFAQSNRELRQIYAVHEERLLRIAFEEMVEDEETRSLAYTLVYQELDGSCRSNDNAEFFRVVLRNHHQICELARLSDFIESMSRAKQSTKKRFNLTVLALYHFAIHGTNRQALKKFAKGEKKRHKKLQLFKRHILMIRCCFTTDIARACDPLSSSNNDKERRSLKRKADKLFGAMTQGRTDTWKLMSRLLHAWGDHKLDVNEWIQVAEKTNSTYLGRDYAGWRAGKTRSNERLRILRSWGNEESRSY